MMGVNRVILIGNLGKDPEIRRMQNGSSVANFSIACNETWKDKTTGERREQVEWINVVIFNDGLVKVAEQYLKKGSRVYIEGKYKTRKWQDKDGKDRYSTEVALNTFGCQLVMLGDREGGPSGREAPPAAAESYGSHRRAPAAAPAGSNGTPSHSRRDDLDDKIPF